MKKGTISKLVFAGILFLITSTNGWAQEYKLVADKVHTKNDVQMMDSALMAIETNEEGDEDFPADEIYEGEWNNEFVKAYSDAAVPDTFRLDLSSFNMPVIGKVTSPYGPRRRRFHYGTDIKLQTGDTVYAAFEGKVRICSYERRGYGNYLVIRHPNGLETVYGHLSGFLVDTDENVEAGQPIALGGNTGRSTGSHLHFEFRFLGQAIDPSEIIDFNHFCTYNDYYVFEKSHSGNNYFNIPFYTQYKPLKGKNVKYYAAKAKQNSRLKKSSKASSVTLAHSKQTKYHTVRSGDTLSTIARRYGVSVTQICRLNGIGTKTTLKVGRSLRCS